MQPLCINVPRGYFQPIQYQSSLFLEYIINHRFLDFSLCSSYLFSCLLHRALVKDLRWASLIMGVTIKLRAYFASNRNQILLLSYPPPLLLLLPVFPLFKFHNFMDRYVLFVLATTLQPNAFLLSFGAWDTSSKPNSMLPLLARQLPYFDHALPTQT
jgi:hypothetical protein